MSPSPVPGRGKHPGDTIIWDGARFLCAQTFQCEEILSRLLAGEMVHSTSNQLDLRFLVSKNHLQKHENILTFIFSIYW